MLVVLCNCRGGGSDSCFSGPGVTSRPSPLGSIHIDLTRLWDLMDDRVRAAVIHRTFSTAPSFIHVSYLNKNVPQVW